MCDYIDLFSARHFYYVLYVRRYLSRALMYTCRRLLRCIRHISSVFCKSFRYPSPVIEQLPVTEEYTVYHYYRVFCAAYLIFRTHIIKLMPCLLKIEFTLCLPVYPHGSDNIYKRQIPGQKQQYIVCRPVLSCTHSRPYKSAYHDYQYKEKCRYDVPYDPFGILVKYHKYKPCRYLKQEQKYPVAEYAGTV